MSTVETSRTIEVGPWLNALVAPISSDRPVGLDLSYEPEFEKLVGEIEKLTSLAGEVPDWSFVHDECARLLGERSKDLRMMTWLVAAKAFTRGWRGIADGLDAYAALSQAFWPTLFPPANRLRARAGQVGWLWEVLAKRVAALPTDASDAELVRSLEPRLREAAARFREYLKDADPGMSALRAALNEKIRLLPEVQAPKEAPPASPSPPSPSPPSPSSPPLVVALPVESAPAAPVAPPPQVVEIAPIAVSEVSVAALDQAFDTARALRDPLTSLAHQARRLAPDSSWPYRLLRTVAWLTVERLPEAESGKTFLRAPKTQERELLANLYAAGQWDGLLEASEEAAAMHIFWLDPHRMTSLALERKGPAFHGARQAVGREVAALLARLDGLSTLSFSNGTPLVSPETIDWLAGEQGRFASRGSTARATDPLAAEGHAALLEALEQRLARGAVDDALAATLADVEASSGARTRFLGHLAVARKAQSTGHLELALALYERLVQQVDSTLERWEPGLSADVLSGALRVLQQIRRNQRSGSLEQGSEDLRESSLFRRLLALDPHAALSSRA